MKIIFLLLTFIFSNSALACFSPIKGPEYDAQVDIQKLEEKNHYRVSVPRYMKGMPNEARIILAYSKGRPGGIPIYEKNEILKPIIQGESLVAEFKVVEKEKRPYIVVMWWPEHAGMCGIQANTGYLEVE